MVTLIIRDDDISYFTPEQVLEKIYRRCWEHAIPVSFSVIPSVVAQNKYYRGYHPFIPEEYTSTSHCYNINDNSALCDCINKKAKEGCAELCMHGFNHSLVQGLPEFCSNDVSEIKDKLARGREILHATFPDAEIRTFVPPFDRISETALKVIIDGGMYIPINVYNVPILFSSLFSLKHKGAFAKTMLGLPRQVQLVNVKTSKIYFYKEKDSKDSNKYVALNKILESRMSENSLFILTNHYWEFFDREFRCNTALFDQWNEFLDVLLRHKDKIHFTTFSK